MFAFAWWLTGPAESAECRSIEVISTDAISKFGSYQFEDVIRLAQLWKTQQFDCPVAHTDLAVAAQIYLMAGQSKLALDPGTPSDRPSGGTREDAIRWFTLALQADINATGGFAPGSYADLLFQQVRGNASLPPPPTPPPPPPPVARRVGWYVGGSIGMDWGSINRRSLIEIVTIDQSSNYVEGKNYAVTIDDSMILGTNGADWTYDCTPDEYSYLIEYCGSETNQRFGADLPTYHTGSWQHASRPYPNVVLSVGYALPNFRFGVGFGPNRSQRRNAASFTMLSISEEDGGGWSAEPSEPGKFGSNRAILGWDLVPSIQYVPTIWGGGGLRLVVGISGWLRFQSGWKFTDPDPPNPDLDQNFDAEQWWVPGAWWILPAGQLGLSKDVSRTLEINASILAGWDPSLARRSVGDDTETETEEELNSGWLHYSEDDLVFMDAFNYSPPEGMHVYRLSVGVIWWPDWGRSTAQNGR